MLPLVVVLSLVSFLSSYYQVKGQKRDLEQDLQKRAEVLAESLEESIEPQRAPQVGRSSRDELQRIVERFGNREHLFGIGIYGRRGEVIAVTPSLATRLSGFPLAVARPDQAQGRGEFLTFGETPAYVYVLPPPGREHSPASLVVVHDAAYIQAQNLRFWRKTFLRLLVELALIALTLWLIVRATISGPIARTVQWMKAFRTGTR